MKTAIKREALDGTNQSMVCSTINWWCYTPSTVCSKRFNLSMLVQLSPLWTSYLLSPHPVHGFYLWKLCQCQQDDAAPKYHVWQTPVCTCTVLLRALPHVYHTIIMVTCRDNPKQIVNAVLQISVLWSCRWNWCLKFQLSHFPDSVLH